MGATWSRCSSGRSASCSSSSCTARLRWVFAVGAVVPALRRGDDGEHRRRPPPGGPRSARRSLARRRRRRPAGAARTGVGSPARRPRTRRRRRDEPLRDSGLTATGAGPRPAGAADPRHRRGGSSGDSIGLDLTLDICACAYRSARSASPVGTREGRRAASPVAARRPLVGLRDWLRGFPHLRPVPRRRRPACLQRPRVPREPGSGRCAGTTRGCTPRSGARPGSPATTTAPRCRIPAARGFLREVVAESTRRTTGRQRPPAATRRAARERAAGAPA